MGIIGFTSRRLNEALQYLHQYGDETTIIAGGTDVLVKYHERLDELHRVLNIWQLEELKSIRIINDQIEVGSLVTHTQLEDSTIIQQNAPLLAEAAGSVGSPQIRNRGTIGGNVANASPAGDTLTPLLALDASVKFVSLDRGEKVVSLEEFLVGPGRHIMKKDELITALIFPIPKDNTVGAFVKLGYRKALAISTVNAAIMLGLQGNLIEDCRIALGAVAPTTKRAKLVEELLQGQDVTKSNTFEILGQLEKDIAPISDIRGSQQYRTDIARELVTQGLQKIVNKEVGRSGR